MKIPQQVAELFNRTGLVAVGTADKNGVPNVVPIFWKKIVNDDTVLLLDNFMVTTKKNLLENRHVCLSFWDPQSEEAYKMKGIATYHASGPVYEEGKRFIQAKKPERVPRGVIEIEVSEIYNITPGPDAGKRL